jgi:hypothetical protein
VSHDRKAWSNLGASREPGREGRRRRPTFVETTVVDDAVFAREASAARLDVVPRSLAKFCGILYLAQLDVGKGLPEAISNFGRPSA